MKTIAYICDCGCETVYQEKDSVGLIVTLPDLFSADNPLNKYTFEITNNVERTQLHFSMSCHRKAVTDLLKGINRATNENDYQFHFKLYSYKFYERIYTASLLRNNADNKRTKKLLQSLGKAGK